MKRWNTCNLDDDNFYNVVKSNLKLKENKYQLLQHLNARYKHVGMLPGMVFDFVTAIGNKVEDRFGGSMKLDTDSSHTIVDVTGFV